MSQPRYVIVAKKVVPGKPDEFRVAGLRHGLVVGAGGGKAAKVRFRTWQSAFVEDPAGQRHALSAEGEVTLVQDGTTVQVAIVPSFYQRITELLMSPAPVALLAAVMCLTLLGAQGKVVYDHACEWFPYSFLDKLGVQCQVASAPGGLLGGGADAEYLQRLLRQDYDGHDVGVIELQRKRDRIERKEDREFMPAGNQGPIIAMGGAKAKAVRAVRLPDRVEHRAAKAERPKLMPSSDDGTPMQSSEAVADLGKDDSTEESAAVETPKEEKEGWGIQDWYDAEDARQDQEEIDTALKYAQFRLRIDPNDLESLSILSYYQYLAQQYPDAERTYDKYIELAPEAAAGYNNKALIYKRRGLYQEEEALYRVAIGYEPDDVTALNNLAVCLAHQGRYDEALVIMKQLEVLDPDDPYADLHRSKIYAQMGNDGKALEYLDKALSGMRALDTLHHIEFRQDIRVDPSFAKLRQSPQFKAILWRYYGKDTPIPE